MIIFTDLNPITTCQYLKRADVKVGLLCKPGVKEYRESGDWGTITIKRGANFVVLTMRRNSSLFDRS